MLPAVLVLGSCDRLPGGGAKVDLDDGSARLSSGARVHEVRIAPDGRGREAFSPQRLRASPGDAVRFESAYSGTHAVAFPPSDLQPQAAEFLAQTGQLASPPLIEPGAAWVLSLEDAPAGEYPFVDPTHQIRGVLVVE